MFARAGFLALMLIAAAGAPRGAIAQPRDTPGLPEVPVRMSDATVRDVRVQVVAVLSATVGAPMAGRLEQFPLHDGDRFKAGDTLARFACAEREGAQAHARATLDLKRRILGNKQQLRSLGNSTGVELDIAAAEVTEATADAAIAQAMSANCTVTAPFTGRIAGVSVHAFQFLPLGAPMLDILSDRDLELEMIVPSRWLTWLKPGAGFDVAIDETTRTYPAELIRLSGKVDPVSRSIKVYARIKGQTDDLLPGMSGRALITAPAGDH
jgi:membrane fusion protein (multidrug efflux system)